MAKKNETTRDLVLPDKGNLTTILSANGSKPSPLKGFAPQHQDIVDYIVKITHEIWEERGIGRLYDYYGTAMKIHTSDGEIFGRDAVIAGTIQALAAFPDRRLYAEDVIWTGNETDGYFSSHRLRHQGTNHGHTEFGNPTGNRVDYRAVADCKVVEGVIVEEWLTRDNLMLIKQLGFDPHAVARRAAADYDPLDKLSVTAEADRLRGQLPPQNVGVDSADFDIEQFVRTSIDQIWNWRLLNKVQDYYSPTYKCESASGRSFYGRNQLINYILQFLAPFPDLAISTDHFCALQEDEQTYRTATRWTMQGTHTGVGVYGKPSGNAIRLMGMTHHHIHNGQFVQEYTVFDEFALLKQIYAGASRWQDDIPF